MLLAEANLTDRCELVATDVSARALARAREGFYSGQSLRRLPPAPAPEGWTESLASVVRTSMKRHDDDDAATAATAATAAISIAPALLSKMDYRNVNLLDAAAVKNLGKFDLVLCRNVLIYFSETAVRKVVSSLADALTTTDEYEAGCASSILIGTSESLLFNTVVRCVTRGGMAFYVNGARLPHTR
jgi:chemotaxis protein methyltransferase CheR